MQFCFGMPENSRYIERSTRRLDLRDYTSIWYRRPGSVVAGPSPEPWVGRMIEQEARYTLDGVLRTLNCIWMNFPANDAACMLKLWQLELASRIGLKIPKTIVTNEPPLVQAFYNDCKGEVIYKLISEQSNFAIPAHETPRGVSTLPLREDDLAFLTQVAFGPHLFQEKIEKACELRVTVVGKKLFAIKIDSQSGKGTLDWRNDYSVDMEPCELPEEIHERCLLLTKNLGLNYGAIDLILTPQGEYVFLEINCAGQYLWIEDRTNLPISLEIARLLSSKAEPLCV